MQETLELINKLQSSGTIAQYAIGGAVGATFYLEPFATEDLDIFVVIPTAPGSSLISLSPIYDYLREHGCVVEGEHIMAAGWPVQFLPASTPLEVEALERASPVDLNGTPTWVIRAEHLAAIALSTGRTKDHARILQFLDQQRIDETLLDDILKRHALEEKWTRFRHRYLEPL
jgi:hypothetical protein